MQRSSIYYWRPQLSRASISLIIIALLGAGAYVGDRFARQHAEQTVAAILQHRLGTPEPPQVDIEGFPFLAHVAVDSRQELHILAGRVGETPEAPLIVAQADLTLIDVDSDDWFRSMKVAHTNGTARVDYARLSSLAGAPLTYAGEGRVEIIVKTTVFGREYEVVLKGLPRLNVKEQTMSLSDAEISVAGVDLPDFTGQALLATRLEPISLKGIPLDLTVTKISAVADGILLELAGDDLRIST